MLRYVPEDGFGVRRRERLVVSHLGQALEEPVVRLGVLEVGAHALGVDGARLEAPPLGQVLFGLLLVEGYGLVS